MAKIPNKLFIFGAVAATALLIPGVLGPLGFQEAQAQPPTERHVDQSGNAVNNARNALAQVAVQANANVEVNDVTACVLVEGGCENQ